MAHDDGNVVTKKLDGKSVARHLLNSVYAELTSDVLAFRNGLGNAGRARKHQRMDVEGMQTGGRAI